MLALIGNIETTELLVVLVGAILVFGKRLPQVAAQAGSQLGKLRRTLDSAWRDSGVDHEVREMQRSIESIRDAVPRDLSAGSVARLAASEFQRRVENNQRAEAGTASATEVAPGSDAPTALAAGELEARNVAPAAGSLAAPAPLPPSADPSRSERDPQP